VKLKIRYLDDGTPLNPCTDLISVIEEEPTGTISVVTIEDSRQAGMNPDGTEP
jgi:hypothetical protein